jgi:hypothetical protein
MTTNQFTSRHGVWVTTVFFALALYSLGAGSMDSFVVYHTWRFIGAADFALAHMESGRRIVPIFVLPMLAMTVFLILMFWHRPHVISRNMLWICLVCIIIPWLSSAFIQIPMQIKLDNGKDEALLDQLIMTDWIRIIPHWIMIGVVLTMISRCLREIKTTQLL